MKVTIDPSWAEKLEEEFEASYFKKLIEFVKAEVKEATVFPAGKLMFQAFDRTPFDQVKVVIIGQDPYHGPGQANGLCFSVNPGVKLPPSLVNIFKERESDIGTPIPQNGDLSHWADQGVLMLNATLTVRARQAGSHQKKGWEEFTDAVIQRLNEEREGLVFILWGAYAQKKGSFIDPKKHFVIQSPHPSPFSAHSGFFGSKPFSAANEYLRKAGKAAVNW